MEKTIYCKQLPKKTESLKEMLLLYFNQSSPETFWSDYHTKQCDARRSRSVDDLLLLSNHYFPGTTIQQMMAAYREINETFLKNNATLIFSVCSTIKRIKLNPNKYPVNDYPTINMVYAKGLDSKAELSQWTMRELAEMEY
jgi:hypothetical protein